MQSRQKIQFAPFVKLRKINGQKRHKDNHQVLVCFKAWSTPVRGIDGIEVVDLLLVQIDASENPVSILDNMEKQLKRNKNRNQSSIKWAE